MSKLRVGVFGGRFGASVHAPALAAVPGVEVVGVASREADPSRGVVGAETLWSQSLDAVTFAVPPHLQPAMFRRALERGLHILAEKPLAPTFAEARELAALVENGQSVATVDFELAELETFRAARDLIAGRVLGPCRRIDVRWVAPSWAQTHRVWNWKSDLSRGGGVLNLLGTHALHLVEMLAGEIVDLHAQLDAAHTRSFAPRPELAAEDEARLFVRTAHGVDVRLVLDNRPGATPDHRWLIRCERGDLLARNPGRDYAAGFRLFDASGRRSIADLANERESSARFDDGRTAALHRLASRWVEQIRLGRPGGPSVHQAAQIQRWVDRARRSAGLGLGAETHELAA